jgi:uncharacterized pyridoxamine 5'-phosphate oxidase family protein
MSKFETLCKKLETMDRDQFADLFNTKSTEVIAKLSSLSLDGKDGVAVYMEFILASAAADGNLAKDEFKLLKPLFDHVAGKSVTYNDAVKMFNAMGLNKPDALKKVVDTMVDIIGLVDEAVKDDIVILCLMVCSIDRDVSEKEKEWIKQLVEPLKIDITPMDYINGFLDRAGSFTLATTCRDQPRMRVLGLKIPMDGKIYFAVGTFKDVYKQLQHNPKCEILASIGTDFIRWDGEAKFSDDPRLMQFVEKAMPDIAGLYKQMGWKFGFFTLEGGSAEFCNVANEKIKIF